MIFDVGQYCTWTNDAVVTNEKIYKLFQEDEGVSEPAETMI